jgi:CubicO group peptidase (beta-lactamase class C family)
LCDCGHGGGRRLRLEQEIVEHVEREHHRQHHRQHTASITASTTASTRAAANASTTFSANRFNPAVQASSASRFRVTCATGNSRVSWSAFSSPQGSFLYPAGYSNLTTHAPLQPQWFFRIGSVTKTFTATVTVQLVQQGKLSLNDSLSKYEPQIPNASKITIRELLNMTSGIRHGTSPTPNAQNPQESLTPQQVIANTTTRQLLFTPGTKYSYSDTGYLILGGVATKVRAPEGPPPVHRLAAAPPGSGKADVDAPDAVAPASNRGPAG